MVSEPTKTGVLFDELEISIDSLGEKRFVLWFTVSWPGMIRRLGWAFNTRGIMAKNLDVHYMAPGRYGLTSFLPSIKKRLRLMEKGLMPVPLWRDDLRDGEIMNKAGGVL